MPQFDFDVTKEATDYAVETMQKIDKNPGQQSLVDNLNIDAYAIVRIYIAGDNVDVKAEYDVSFGSPHEEAIVDILAEGEAAFQEFAERAADILSLIDEAWKALG